MIYLHMQLVPMSCYILLTAFCCLPDSKCEHFIFCRKISLGGWHACTNLQKVGIVSVSGQAPGACSLFFPSPHHQSNEFLSGKCSFLSLFFFFKCKKQYTSRPSSPVITAKTHETRWHLLLIPLGKENIIKIFGSQA